MKFIESKGSFYVKNTSGYLLNTTSLKNIPISILNFIDVLKHEYQLIFKEIDSIYVRGSVVEGKFRYGFSDVDTFVLIPHNPSTEQLIMLKNTSKKLTEQFEYSTRIDLECITINQLLFNSDYKFMQVVIKVQAHLIWGSNYIQNSLPDFKADSSLISLLFNIENRINFGKEKLKTGKVSEVMYWCQWLMKTIIRACFELVIDRVNEYTRDLYFCFATFSDYYPEKREICYIALNLAINPNNQISQINDIIDSFGYWVIKEAKKIYPNRNLIINKPISTKYLTYE